jgi:hypothetical protein
LRGTRTRFLGGISSCRSLSNGYNEDKAVGERRTAEMRFWDKYGVWIVVFVVLLIRSNYAAFRNGDSELWQAFLLFNGMLSFGAGYVALVRISPLFAFWAPLIMRWLARLVVYTPFWLIPAVYFTQGDGFKASFVALTIAGLFVARRAWHDTLPLRRRTAIA